MSNECQNFKSLSQGHTIIGTAIIREGSKENIMFNQMEKLNNMETKELI